MEINSKRRNAPNWPPFKQPYQQLGSQENLTLTPLPGHSNSAGTPPPPSSIPSANVFSPDFNSNTAYTPSRSGQPFSPHPLLRSQTHAAAPPKRKKWYEFGYGWRTSSRIALFCAVAVLVTNICMTIGIVASGRSMGSWTYMVYAGDCRETELKDTWVHLALNVVATVLLASSNYCMQLLSSPSRREIDRAHSKHKWLDIGIPSIRNLGSLKRRKVAIWLLLGFSSVPLHLVYNSIFYSALATNNYSILYAADSFAQGASYDRARFPDSEECNVTDIQSRAQSFTVLDNQDCIEKYARDFVEDRRNVIVVVKNPPTTNNGSLFKVATNEFPAVITAQYDPFAWICDSPNVVNQTQACCENEWGVVPCMRIAPKLVSIANQWETGGFQVDHGLSEPVPSQCHLHFSLILMSVVLGFNVLKVICITYVVFRLGEAPLVTVGDAIQSFLRHPDRTTEGMSLASHASVIASARTGYIAMQMRYSPQQHRFYEAPTWRQWFFLLGVFGFAGIGTALCLGLGISNFKGDKTIQNAWEIGLGTVRPQNLVMGWNLPGYGNSSIAVSTLIANAPQVLFSFLYVCYNSLFTVMFLSRETMRFSVMAGRGRKYLRVSDPRGEQKSTYFLNLPYKYGLPLLIASGLMHWLVSQAIFLANITIIPRDGRVPMQDEITTVAYSPIAMLFMLILGLALVAFLLANAARKLPVGMPLMSSNSIAISAACHPTVGADQSVREDMVLRPLSWGAVPGRNPKNLVDLGIRHIPSAAFDDDIGDAGDEWETTRNMGHCTFSDGVLEAPEPGRLYA